jgi:hypothetical protein
MINDFQKGWKIKLPFGSALPHIDVKVVRGHHGGALHITVQGSALNQPKLADLDTFYCFDSSAPRGVLYIQIIQSREGDKNQRS